MSLQNHGKERRFDRVFACPFSARYGLAVKDEKACRVSLRVAKVPEGRTGLRWDLKSQRWERVKKTWFPDDRASSLAFDQVVARIGAVQYQGARGVWLALWKMDGSQLPTVQIFQTFANKNEATTYALGAIGYDYAHKYAGDWDLRVVLFTRSELDGFQFVNPEGFEPMPLPTGVRRARFFLP